jgi:hypothetical protein
MELPLRERMDLSVLYVRRKEEVSYDSTSDTISHIERVRSLLDEVIARLRLRGARHDASKLREPEKSIFDEYTPLLRSTTYDTPEYYRVLDEMKVGLAHHFENNSHHPEHYEDGLDGMSIIDVLEMFVDWKAATERHADGDFEASLRTNSIRFTLSPQLANIFWNTALELGWITRPSSVFEESRSDDRPRS